MKIEKASTRQYDQYEVLTTVTRTLPQNWLQRLFDWKSTEQVEVKLVGVVEADDATGLAVEHIRDEKGDYVYTNGVDDIVIGNTERLLLLTPFVRQAFLFAKYQPKLKRTYYPNLKIKFRGPLQQDIVIEQIISDQEKESA